MRESIIQTTINMFLTWLAKKAVTALYKRTHFWTFSWGLDENTDLYLMSEESYHDYHRFGVREEKYADTPQTEMDKCYKCKWWNYSYGCSNKKGICDFEQADTPQTDCPFKDVPCSCGEQDECEWHTELDTPQTKHYDYSKSEMENIKCGNGITTEIPQNERSE